MPSKFSIVEPHPSVPRTGGYIACGGRGGAGNYRRYNPRELTPGPSAQGPPSRFPLTTRASSSSTSSAGSLPSLGRSKQQHPVQQTLLHSTGIGGAGNMFARADTEERVFQFDEEMVKRREGGQTPVYHIGRGGGGNWVDETKPRPGRLGSASSTESSSDASEVGSVNSEGSHPQMVPAAVARPAVKQGAFGRWRGRFTS